MTIAAPDASDVPGFFDCIINGQGYVFANTVDQSLPFRVQRASYSYTPTFLERTNVGQGYSDNQQDFFLTASQNDWTSGETQRFFHPGDADSRRQYWAGTNVDITTTPGQVGMRNGTITVTSPSFTFASTCGGGWQSAHIYAEAAGILYRIDTAGTVTTLGSHGAGGGTTSGGMCADGKNIFIDGGTTIRSYNISAASFSAFSATSSQHIAYFNNAIYGADGSLLRTYSTTGVPSTIFTWQGGTGATTIAPNLLIPFGPNLLIAGRGVKGDGQLWVYDGVAPHQIANFASNFVPDQGDSLNGIAYIGGHFLREGSTNQAALYAFAGGSLYLIWKSKTRSSAWYNTSVVAFQGGVIFTDEPNGLLLFYDPPTGSVSTIASFTAATSNNQLVANTSVALLNRADVSTNYLYPSTSLATSATVTGSLIDFDNALTKMMRGIKVDFDSATTGDGGTVDISYRVNDVDGAYTSLQVGAVSGTEYPITGVTGRSISVKVTLNKGTSTLGPVLKRVYVRAAPVMQAYRLREFILDCSGRDGLTHVRLRNGSDHPLDGQAQVTNLIAAATSATPISITDRQGTFTGVIEPGKTEFIEIRPEEYIVRVLLREV